MKKNIRPLAYSDAKKIYNNKLLNIANKKFSIHTGYIF